MAELVEAWILDFGKMHPLLCVSVVKYSHQSTA